VNPKHEPGRREFLKQAGAFALAQLPKSTEGTMLVENAKGGFRFLRGIAPYSSGAVALAGYEVVHATLVPPEPYRKGFETIDRHFEQQARPSEALCGIELRSPRPFTFSGFNEFNQRYLEMLEKRGILAGGLNPVARTNVAPEIDPPTEVLLYGFSYAVPSSAPPVTFVVAGAGELKSERLDPSDIVRRGDRSEKGLREKAAQVLRWMEERLRGLGAGWTEATAVGVYTVHDIFPLMREFLVPRLGAAGIHGVRWHFARPPIEEIEFEMDLRGCLRELVVRTA
jgi:hypothetical protein